MAKLQPVHVREWHTTLVRESGLHPTTVAKCYRLLRSILNTAVEDELLAANPCRIRNAGVERSKERPIPTLEQVAQMADALPDHLSVVVWIAALCGLRKGEIFGLARRHIDLEAGTITVERSLQEITGEGAVLVEPKTKSSHRIVTVPPQLLPVLGTHLAKAGRPTEMEALLFTNSLGRPIRSTVWAKAWREMRCSTGLADVRLHDLRHLAGTLTAQAGATVRETMERLGHSTMSASMRYQHVFPDRPGQIAERILDDDVL